LIPQQALAVYESGECDVCAQETAVLLPFLELLIPADRKSEDSMAQNVIRLMHPVKNGLISLHITQRDRLGIVNYIPDHSISAGLKNLLGALSQQSSTRLREFNGISIREYSKEGLEVSWTRIESYWIISYQSLLVEDVIRTYKSKGNESFSRILTTSLMTTVRNDAGNLYINYSDINAWLAVFTGKSPGLLTPGLSAVMDVKAVGKTVVLTGFTTDPSVAPSLLSALKGQTPATFTAKQFISNRAILSSVYGITDGNVLQSRLDIAGNKVLQDSLSAISGINYAEFYTSLDNELVISLYESRDKRASKIFLIQTTDIKTWLNALDQIEKKTSTADSIYSERYSTYTIRKLDYPHFPEKLFSPLVHGFSTSYYTHIGNTLLISERSDQLKALLNDIDTEEVWGKSVSTNQFIESTLLESNISLYINTPRALNFMLPSFTPLWRKGIESMLRESSIHIGWTAFQFSNLNQNFYTNIIISTETASASPGKATSGIHQIQTNIDTGFRTRPKVVRNHATKRDEFVVQDSSNTLHYLSADGKHQWRKRLDGPIAGDVFQIDYLANNKLQLLTITNNRLYIIDRLSNDVKPFPIALPTNQPEFVNVIDYDNSKRYRYIIADKAGKIWMMDKEGKLLDGWKPKHMEGSLLLAPSHHRIAGRDYITAVRKDGTIYVLNRRGENSKGFPLTTNERPEGAYHLEEGNSAANSLMTIVSRTGVKISFTLEGKIIGHDQLVKSSVEDQFGLLEEESGKSYLVKRYNARQLSILDGDGNVLVTNEYIGNHPHDIRYYDFGSGNAYIAITDLEEDLCYVYSRSGLLLTPVPVEASGVSLKMEAGNLLIIAVNGKSFSIHPLH
jgi:hypothetical protein